jgi:hypothetical protein
MSPSVHLVSMTVARLRLAKYAAAASEAVADALPRPGPLVSQGTAPAGSSRRPSGTRTNQGAATDGAFHIPSFHDPRPACSLWGAARARGGGIVYVSCGQTLTHEASVACSDSGAGGREGTSARQDMQRRSQACTSSGIPWKLCTDLISTSLTALSRSPSPIHVHVRDRETAWIRADRRVASIAVR